MSLHDVVMDATCWCSKAFITQSHYTPCGHDILCGHHFSFFSSRMSFIEVLVVKLRLITAMCRKQVINVLLSNGVHLMSLDEWLHSHALQFSIYVSDGMCWICVWRYPNLDILGGVICSGACSIWLALLLHLTSKSNSMLYDQQSSV